MQKLAMGLMAFLSVNLIACSKSEPPQQPVIASQTVSIQKSDNSSTVSKDVVVGNSQQTQTTQTSTQQVVESKKQVVPADCTPKMGVDAQGDAAWVVSTGCDQSQTATTTPPSTQSTTPTMPAGAAPQAYVAPSSGKVVTATTIPTALPKGTTNGHVEVKQTTVTKKTEQQILQPTK